MGARALAVSSLAPLAAAAHADLSDGREELSLVYQPHLGGAVDGQQAASLARQELAAAFAQELGRWSEREVRAGTTILGPHRDDLLVELDGVSAAAFASRAQQRTIALALRLSEARFLRQRRGDSPVLLLDDVLSELDAHRRAAVLAAVADYEQVIITATDLDRFSPDFLARAALFRVAAGSVEPMACDRRRKRGRDSARQHHREGGGRHLEDGGIGGTEVPVELYRQDALLRQLHPPDAPVEHRTGPQVGLR